MGTPSGVFARVTTTFSIVLSVSLVASKNLAVTASMSTLIGELSGMNLHG